MQEKAPSPRRHPFQQMVFATVLIVTVLGAIFTTFDGQSFLSELIVGAQLWLFGGYSPLFSGMAFMLLTILLAGWFLSLVFRGTLIARLIDLLSMPIGLQLALLVLLGAGFLTASFMAPSLSRSDMQTVTVNELAAAKISRHKAVKLSATTAPHLTQGWLLPIVPTRYGQSGGDIYDSYTPMLVRAPGDPAEPVSVFYVSRSLIGKRDVAEPLLANPAGFVRRRRLPVAIRHRFERAGISVAGKTYVFTDDPQTPRFWLWIGSAVCFMLAVIALLMKAFPPKTPETGHGL